MNRPTAFLLMLANAVLVFAVTWSGDSPDDTLTTGLLYAAALGVMALLLLARPGGKPAIMGRGIAVAIIAIVGAFGLFGMVALLLLENVSVSITELVVAAAFLGIQFLLLKELRLDEAHRARGRAYTVIAAFITGAALLVLSLVGSLTHNVAEIVLLIPRLRADSVMKSSIPRIQACAVASAQRAGGYPASLAAMGPAPEGDGCLDARYASGRVGRVMVSYAPGPPDGARRAASYQVFARTKTGVAGGPQIAFGDESGIVRAGDSAGSPMKLKILHGGMVALRSVRACAEYYRDRESPDSAYPPDVKRLFPVYPAKETEENLARLGCSPTQFPTFGSASRAWNVGTYTPLGDPVRPKDYLLEIRPRVYGVTGVRSIRTTARGFVHSTVEDRPATDTDPVVPRCAYEVEDGNCAPDPGGVPARVDVILPDTASPGEPFTVTIVDRRADSARGKPYQYQILCNHRMYVDSEPPDTYTSSPSAECAGKLTPENESEGSIGIRVWIRDHAGSETSIDRRVRLAEPRQTTTARTTRR